MFRFPSRVGVLATVTLAVLVHFPEVEHPPNCLFPNVRPILICGGLIGGEQNTGNLRPNGVMNEAVCGIYGIGSVQDDFLKEPFVKGWHVAVPWRKLEPAKGRFDWPFWDKELAKVATAGKWISIQVGPADQPYGRFARGFEHASGRDQMAFERQT